MTRTSHALYWMLLLLVIAGSGVAYSAMVYGGHPLIGAVFSLGACGPVLAFERGFIFRGVYRRIRRLPTLLFIVAALFIFFLLMTGGFAAAGTLLWWAGMMTRGSWADAAVLPFDVMLYTLAVCAAIVFVLRVRELLGRDIFVSLFVSRYRNPVREERVFLFIDLVDSTSFAEEFGDLQAQKFLSSLFTVIAEPVRRNRGTIDDYVGDCAIITWPLKRGVEDARCVRCVFDIIEEIDSHAAAWKRKYHRVPQLRAALHGGEIITAEIGVDHHKITYFGDTVNTTARLESLCRTLNAPVLISTDLAQRITLPDTVRGEYLGDHAVKGRGHAVGVIALTQVERGRLRIPRQLALDFTGL